MHYTQQFTKEQAIENAKKFLAEVRKLEEQFSMSFNSDTGDIYLSYKPYEGNIEYKNRKHWDSVNIGWSDKSTGLDVIETSKEDKKEIALSKLTDDDKIALGLDL